MGQLPTQEKIEVVPAQTLAGASAVITSAAVRCLGALEVYFITKATNATQPSVAVFEYSVDEGVNFVAGSGTYFESANDIVTTDNSKGRLFVISPRSSTGAKLARIPATHVRLKVTGNAGASPANDIANFRVDAVVVSQA